MRSLITWIDANSTSEETWSIRATELARGRKAACEIHALAVAVLQAFGVRARWISGARSSPGFGYLEAYVDGAWQLYRLRSGGEPAVGKSAWELYRESEPGLNIRLFYPRAGKRLASWQGGATVALFPFVNVELHAELEGLLRGIRGLPLVSEDFNPYDYFYDWGPDADGRWVEEGRTREMFARRHAGVRHKRLWATGALLNLLE